MTKLYEYSVLQMVNNPTNDESKLLERLDECFLNALSYEVQSRLRWYLSDLIKEQGDDFKTKIVQIKFSVHNDVSTIPEADGL